MKRTRTKSIFLRYVILATYLTFTVTYGNSSSIKNKLIGSWKFCSNNDNNSTQYVFIFKNNKKGKELLLHFKKLNCKDLKEKEAVSDFSYEVGKETKDSNGLKAYELNLYYIPKKFGNDYRMFRFGDNGNFELSYPTKDKNGSSILKRSNYFRKWESYKKFQM